jgi:hypothetical protein
LPYSWDIAQEKSKCSQTQPHLGIIVVLKSAKKTPPGMDIFHKFWALSGFEPLTLQK